MKKSLVFMLLLLPFFALAEADPAITSASANIADSVKENSFAVIAGHIFQIIGLALVIFGSVFCWELVKDIFKK